VLLLWIYYSAQIFLLGAEFTRVFAYAHGTRILNPMDDSHAPGLGQEAGRPNAS
jgi:membrane protein